MKYLTITLATLMLLSGCQSKKSQHVNVADTTLGYIDTVSKKNHNASDTTNNRNLVKMDVNYLEKEKDKLVKSINEKKKHNSKTRIAEFFDFNIKSSSDFKKYANVSIANNSKKTIVSFAYYFEGDCERKVDFLKKIKIKPFEIATLEINLPSCKVTGISLSGIVYEDGSFLDSGIAILMEKVETK